MAILYGTTGDGTTLPVLVDQFGNLLAKGIDGQPGPEGPQGPPGLDGGSFALPPDPYEGAYLGWLNNGLAWVGSPPVPLPAGVFGPITGWDPAGFLTVEGEIPAEIKQGGFVYQCNEDGTIFVEGWNNSQNWSAGTTATNISTNFNGVNNVPCFITDIYNGSTEIGLYSEANTLSTIDLSSLTLPAGTFEVYLGLSGNTNSAGATYNGDQLIPGLNAAGWYTLPVTPNTIEVTHPSGNYTWGLHAIRINNNLLVDQGEYPTAPSLTYLVESVTSQTLIGSANRTDDFTIGKYLRVPE
jgi:hypothetical protein